MIKIKPTYLAVVLAMSSAVVFIACSESGESTSDTDISTLELQKVEQEVLDIHDEVMPKMGDLNNNRKKLIKRLYTSDSLEFGLRINESIDHLEEADSLMWDWMHNYSRPNYDSDPDSVGAYLNAELVKVKVMREKFFKSLSESESLLEQLNANDE